MQRSDQVLAQQIDEQHKESSNQHQRTNQLDAGSLHQARHVTQIGRRQIDALHCHIIDLQAKPAGQRNPILIFFLKRCRIFVDLTIDIDQKTLGFASQRC